MTLYFQLINYAYRPQNLNIIKNKMEEKEEVKQNEENMMNINEINDKNEIINEPEINNLDKTFLIMKLIELQKNIKENVSLKTLCN